MEKMEYFLSSSKSVSESMICPPLLEWIAKQLERDANVQKQYRKAREERALARN